MSEIEKKIHHLRMELAITEAFAELFQNGTLKEESNE